MVNEKKVIKMTNMAIFEKRHGNKDMNIVNYFRSDYIGFQILKAVIAATLSCLAVFAVYIFYNFETIMSEIYEMDYVQVGKQLLTIYLVVVGGYAFLCYVLYTYRYSKAKKELKGFYADLRSLSNRRS